MATAPDKAEADATLAQAQLSHPGRPSLPITEAAVAAVVEKGRPKDVGGRVVDVFDDCLGAFHMLRLVVAGTRVSLTDVDGMPFAATVPLDACLRDGLRRLAFPHAHKPVAFTIPLDLRAAEGTPG